MRLAQGSQRCLKISIIMKWLEAEYDKAFVFVTLTAPNVKAEDLQAEIDLYNKAFQRLVKRKEIAPIFDGYIRKLEVTYNADQQTYHPHFHVLFVVNKSYFTSRYYVKQAKWLELWREVTGDERITQVDVRRLKTAPIKARPKSRRTPPRTQNTCFRRRFSTYFTTPFEGGKS